MSSIYSWSTTAAGNGNADAAINFAEGQAPSTLNNSNRQVMGRIAELIADIGSNVTVDGTATAITIAANSAFEAYATGLRLVFRARATNTGAATLNVNFIGAKSIRKIGPDGDAELSAGDIRAGSLYEVVYSDALNSAAGGWQLMSPTPIPAPRNDYVPTGAGMDYWGDTAPAGYIFAYGQAISRTSYAALFAVYGTKYGTGDGSSTFNVPDKRGRASFGKDDMGGTAANRLTTAGSGINGSALGAAGGAETVTLTTAQMPAHSHTGTADSAGAHTHQYAGGNANGGPASGSGQIEQPATLTTSSAGAHTHSLSIANTGGGLPHNNVPPGIVCNYIIRT